MLSRLVTIYEILQQVHSEFEEASKQEDPAIGEAKRTLAAKQKTLEATHQELISIKKLKAKTSLELARLNVILQDAEQKEERLQQTWASQDLGVKESDRQLRDVTAKANQQVTNKLQAKTANLHDEAAQLFASLNKSEGSSSA